MTTIPINTAALALPVAGQPVAVAGTDVAALPSIAVPNGGSLGQTNAGVAQLFAMLLAQLSEGKNPDTGTAPLTGNKPDTDVTVSKPKPSNPKEPDIQQQLAALPLIPVLVALNPELAGVPNPAIADPVSIVAGTPEATTPVIAPKVSILNVPAPSLPVQTVIPTGPADENHAPVLSSDVGALVAPPSTDKIVSSQSPIAAPDTTTASSRVPITPMTPRIFSSIIDTPAHQTSTTPVPDQPSLLPTPPVDNQQNPVPSSAHVVVPIALSSTGAERHDLQKPELQREPMTARQDNAAQQALSDQLTLGSEKIPVELVAAPPPPSHPLEAPVPVSKVIVTLPETVPAIVPSRETLHVQLEPSELGRVTLQVSVQSQQVQATVGVEHHGLGQYLTASQGALDDALRHHGLRIEEFHVETIGSTDVNGLGAGRTGLEQGSPEREASQFQRPEEHTRYPEVHVPEIGRTIPLDNMTSQYRISIFA